MISILYFLSNYMFRNIFSNTFPYLEIMTIVLTLAIYIYKYDNSILYCILLYNCHFYYYTNSIIMYFNY